MKEHFISVIVPAYNEQKAVAGVLQALIDSKIVNEVICVNDGSTDGTLEIINQFKDDVKIINLINNMGKGYAMARGIEEAKGDIVVFLDADLTNLSDEHINALIEPLLKSTHIASMGYLLDRNGTRILGEMTKDITGQRAYFKKDLIPHIKVIEETRFGVEMYLNGVFDKEKVSKFELEGLRSLFKHEKFSTQEAIREYFKEGIEIAKAIANTEISPQKDIEILRKLSETENYQKIDQKIQQITSIKIKDILQDYFEKYIQELGDRFKSNSKKD